MAEREADQAQGGRDSALRAVQCRAFLVGVGVGLTLSLAFAAEAFRGSDGPLVTRVDERINPNEAPAASLMRLPQIGVARARAIVMHRNRTGSRDDRQRVFQTADDLRQIKGIGPAIVEDLRPWLQFDDPPRDGNEFPRR